MRGEGIGESGGREWRERGGKGMGGKGKKERDREWKEEKWGSEHRLQGLQL